MVPDNQRIIAIVNQLVDHTIVDDYDGCVRVSIPVSGLIYVIDELKNSPETQYEELKSIIVTPIGEPVVGFNLMYRIASTQLQSTVLIAIEIPFEHLPLPSLEAVFPGAKGVQSSVTKSHGIVFDSYPRLTTLLLERFKSCEERRRAIRMAHNAAEATLRKVGRIAKKRTLRRMPLTFFTLPRKDRYPFCQGVYDGSINLSGSTSHIWSECWQYCDSECLSCFYRKSIQSYNQDAWQHETEIADYHKSVVEAQFTPRERSLKASKDLIPGFFILALTTGLLVLLWRLF
jgi:NADH:ubiquinone oxidoreductase subunit C